MRILLAIIMGAMSANAGDYRDRKAIEDASAQIAAEIQRASWRSQWEAWDIERKLERIETQQRYEIQREKQRQYWETILEE